MPSGDNKRKITAERVAQFKAVMHDGRTLIEHQKEFSEVTASTLSDIRCGISWVRIKPAVITKG